MFSGTMVMFGGSMGINVINYFYHLIMGRILGPEGYGVLASIFSLLYIVSIVPLSTSISIVKFISSAKNENELAKTYYAIKNFVFKFSIILLIIVILLTPVLTSFLNIEDIVSVLMVGPIMYFSIITLVNQATAQGLLNFVGFVVPNLVSSIGKLILGVALVAFGFLVTGAVGGILIATALGYLASVFAVKNNLKQADISGNFDLKIFLKYSLPVLLQAFAFTALFSVDVLLAKHFLTPVDAGIYAAVSTLGKVIYFATSPISSVMFPIISKKHSKKENINKILLLSLLLTFGISLFVTILYTVFPKIAVGLLFGKTYLSGAINLPLIGLFMIFYSVSYLLVNFFLAIGKTFVVSYPIIASVAQASLIYFRFHNNAREIIEISLWITIALTVILVYFLKNEKYP